MGEGSRYIWILRTNAPRARPAPAKRRPRGKSSPLPLIIIALATLLIVALAINSRALRPRAAGMWLCRHGRRRKPRPRRPSPRLRPRRTRPRRRPHRATRTRKIRRPRKPTRTRRTARPRRTVRSQPPRRLPPAAAQFAQRTVEENNGVVPAPHSHAGGGGLSARVLQGGDHAEGHRHHRGRLQPDGESAPNRAVRHRQRRQADHIAHRPEPRAREPQGGHPLRLRKRHGAGKPHLHPPGLLPHDHRGDGLGDLHEQPRRQRDAGRGLSDALHAHARRRQPPRFAHPPVHGKDGLLRHGPLDAERLLLQRGRTEERAWRRATSTCSTPRTTTLASSSASSPTPRSRATGW